MPGTLLFRDPSVSESHATKRGTQRGATVLEFAVIAPLFFLLLCGIFDFAHLFFVQMTMQDAIRQAGRFAVTGNSLPDAAHPGKNLSRVDSIIKTAQEAGVGTDITKVQVSSKNGGNNNAGGPGDVVTVSVTNDLQLITPIISRFFGKKGIYTFDVSVTFKNEPFNPNKTL